MARIPQVTRTITTTQVTALCLNIVTAEPCNKTVTLPRTYKDTKKLEALLRNKIDTDEEKFVSIVSKEEIETLYGMTEEKFVQLADVLEKR